MKYHVRPDDTPDRPDESKIMNQVKKKPPKKIYDIRNYVFGPMNQESCFQKEDIRSLLFNMMCSARWHTWSAQVIMNLVSKIKKRYSIAFVWNDVFGPMTRLVGPLNQVRFNGPIRPVDTGSRPVEVSARWNAARWSVGPLKWRPVAIPPNFEILRKNQNPLLFQHTLFKFL